MIVPIDREAARLAAQEQYGGTATFEYTSRVHFVTPGLVWDGPVHVFMVHGQTPALRASVWKQEMAGQSAVRVVAHVGGILSPADAVRSVLLNS